MARKGTAAAVVGWLNAIVRRLIAIKGERKSIESALSEGSPAAGGDRQTSADPSRRKAIDQLQLVQEEEEDLEAQKHAQLDWLASLEREEQDHNRQQEEKEASNERFKQSRKKAKVQFDELDNSADQTGQPDASITSLGSSLSVGPVTSNFPGAPSFAETAATGVGSAERNDSLIATDEDISSESAEATVKPRKPTMN